MKASPAASAPTSVDPKNLTPDGITSLLESEFAAAPETPPKSPAKEVQAGDSKSGGDKTPTKEPQWSADQAAWFDLRRQASTPEEIAAADAQAPAFSEEQSAWIESQNAENGNAETLKTELPAEVLSQVKAWEDAGGALPPQLQAIVDKRIGREVGKVKELEAKAQTAEAEVQRLTAELETRGQRTEGSHGLDEKSLTQLVEVSKKFQSDARAFLGGYADDAQTERLTKHMEKAGQDEKGLRRQLDEVNDWLTQDVPALRQRVQAFRHSESQIAPIVSARFPSLEKKDSEENKWAAEVKQLMPELATRTPAHRLALGVYALGKVAWDHLSKASAEGDVIEALKSVLGKHVPLPANGNGNGNGHAKFFLPGKAPAKGPTGGRAFIAPRVEGKRGQEEAASEALRNNPTAENVTESLRIALR